MPKTPTLIAFATFASFALIALFRAMSNLRMLNHAAEHDAALRNWHLRQLVLEEAGSLPGSVR